MPFSVFLNDFRSVLEPHLIAPAYLLVTGDFNIHVDVPNDGEAKRFLDLLDTMNLSQHIHEPTHILGHKLDLIITRQDESNFIQNLSIDWKISDHFTVLFNVTIQKPPPLRKNLTFRKVHKINTDVFKSDLRVAISQLEPCHSIEGVVGRYNDTLGNLIDQHAPNITRTVTIRHHSPWYTEELRREKITRRQLEKVWRTSRSEEDLDAFRKQRQLVADLTQSAKKSFFGELLAENKHNPKNAFKVIDTLLHRNDSSPLPPFESAEVMANQFADFFIGKIEKVRDNLYSSQPLDSPRIIEEKRYTTELSEFQPVTSEDLKKIIMKAPTKSCSLDPGPSWLVKKCIDDLLPLILSIVNMSLKSGLMPGSLKKANIIPMLKKVILELILKNFRPVSNLTFISKIIERVVAKQMINHIRNNMLEEVMQNAYKEFHSPETALLRVHNDILQKVDGKYVVALFLIDLRAAFDTIDHSILLR